MKLMRCQHGPAILPGVPLPEVTSGANRATPMPRSKLNSISSSKRSTSGIGSNV